MVADEPAACLPLASQGCLRAWWCETDWARASILYCIRANQWRQAGGQPGRKALSFPQASLSTQSVSCRHPSSWENAIYQWPTMSFQDSLRSSCQPSDVSLCLAPHLRSRFSYLQFSLLFLPGDRTANKPSEFILPQAVFPGKLWQNDTIMICLYASHFWETINPLKAETTFILFVISTPIFDINRAKGPCSRNGLHEENIGNHLSKNVLCEMGTFIYHYWLIFKNHLLYMKYKVIFESFEEVRKRKFYYRWFKALVVFLPFLLLPLAR